MEHIMETLPQLRVIVDELEEIKKGVVSKSSISYTSQDARMVALDSLQITMSSSGMWINAFNSLANVCTKDGKFDSAAFLNTVGSGVNVQQTEMIMIDFIRLGFMTLVHFKIDNLFHNLLKHLNALPRRTGYWNLTDTILEECGLSKIGAEKEHLTAFANLRNSLHGNGIHRTDSLNIKIDGIAFDFTKGQRVECASWNHIIVLLRANVAILKTVILSNRIVAITSEVGDDFASGR